MTPRRPWLFAILAVLAGCRDVAAPASDPAFANPQLGWSGPGFTLPSPAGIHMLRQAADAPPLETYQVSFWACDGEASTVTVNYQPVGAQPVGQPFLRFDIPKNALVTDAGGERMKRGDSVLVTLTIDPVTFAVDFQPSGVWFSRGIPAQLTIWYENADPDLNGDGVTDASDQLLQQEIALWGHAADTPWVRLPSDNDTTLPSVSTVLRHFSEYAVSW
jgi:hypothetical protein